MSDHSTPSGVNPWGAGLAIAGIVLVLIGAILLGLSTATAVLQLTGLVVTVIGGVMVACWALVGGIGWHLRRMSTAPAGRASS